MTSSASTRQPAASSSSSVAGWRAVANTVHSPRASRRAVARPIPIQASRIALAAASEGTPLIVVDPGSDTQTVVRAPAFRALATGEAWTPAFEDAEVAAAFGASVEREDAVAAIGLAPGDPEARLAGPELVVVLRFVADVPDEARQAALARLQERWAADELIATRVDSIAVRTTS